MNTILKILSLLVPFLIISCDKEYNNPYDRECPPEIWTPENIVAILSENGIEITWEQAANHFDGFILERSSDSVLWGPVNSGLVDKTSRHYTDKLTSALQRIYYRIYAVADKNVSNISYSQALRFDVPTDGLVAYYPFNGNANDESGNNHNGTVTGAVLTSNRMGAANSAYSFDGLSDYIYITNSSLISGSYVSISIWVKTDGTTQGFPIISGNQNDYNIFVDKDSATVWIVTNQASATSPCTGFWTKNGYLPPDQWNHIVLNYDGITLKMYINNMLSKSIPATGKIWTPQPDYLTFGVYFLNGSPNTTNTYKGKLDDVRIYNRALSEPEINQLFHEGGYTEPEIVADFEGNLYNTIKIGTQVWMAENLKSTKFNNGNDISNIAEDATWSSVSTPAFCYYNNNQIYKDIYGLLYNWFTVDAASNGNKNVCPSGWHVPSDSEWSTLTTFLGGISVAGGKLKESGTIHWAAPNAEATNESGFTALPAGSRHFSGFFGSLGDYGNWWTSTAIDAGSSFVVATHKNGGDIIRNWNDKNVGFSVRCVKD
jgi:uncharacterized protein (TIGR02145 family)